MNNWQDPETLEEVKERLEEVRLEIENHEIDNPLELEDGEIVEMVILNRELTKINTAFLWTNEMKDRCTKLVSISKRMLDQKRARSLLYAGAMTEIYLNAALQKAFAEMESSDERETYDKSKVVSAGLHDERSRLCQYREDIYQIGHNVRKEMSIQ